MSALLALPGQDVEFVRGVITPAQAGSHRPSSLTYPPAFPKAVDLAELATGDTLDDLIKYTLLQQWYPR